MFPLRDENPTRQPAVVNSFLIWANVAIFVLELLFGERLLLSWSFIPARFTALLAGDGSFSTLLTFISAMFLHGSIGHIVGNMLFLWIFGDNIEDNFGSGPYLFFYLVCGIVATLVQWFIDPQSSIPNLGASGAISGVLGAYLLLYPTVRVRVFVWPFSLFLGTFGIPAFIWIGIWFLLQLSSGLEDLGRMMEGGVAFWAHIGGFVSGLVLVFVFRQRRQPPARSYWIR